MDQKIKHDERAHSDPGPTRGGAGEITPPPSLRAMRGLPPLVPVTAPSSLPVRLRRIRPLRPRWKRITGPHGHRLVRLELRSPPSPDIPDVGLDIAAMDFSDSSDFKHRVTPSPPVTSRIASSEVQTSTQAALRTLLRAICPGPEHRKLRRVILALATLIVTGGVITLTGLSAAKQA